MKAQEGSLKINETLNNTLNDFLKFPLAEAIAGRRSRRFCMGAEIPDGVLSFKSKNDPLPLREIEQLLLLSYMGGVTGWHFAIMRHERYAPKLSNYSAEIWSILEASLKSHIQERLAKQYQKYMIRLNQVLKMGWDIVQNDSTTAVPDKHILQKKLFIRTPSINNNIM
jgi:hypothetical protein